MNKRTRNTLIWIAAIIGFLVALHECADMLEPGSFEYAERYKLDASEKEVLSAVKLFRDKHPEMVDSSLIHSEGRQDSFSDDLYFYLPRYKEILYTSIRPNDDGTTDFNLVSVNESADKKDWRVVNKDLSSNDDQRIKYQFEAILMHLNIKYKDRGYLMSLW